MGESESTGPTYAQGRGWSCEQAVAEWLRRQGFDLIYQRHKFYGVEVDLIARHPGHRLWWLVEVKSLNSLDWLGGRWRLRQRKKLQRVAQIWGELHESFSTQMVLALVLGPQKQIKILFVEDEDRC